MKPLALVILVVAAMTPHELRPITLIGRRGITGHACPTVDAIYTAYHMIEEGPTASPYGNTITLYIDPARDVAIISVNHNPMHTLPRFAVADSVKKGEKVHWYEYNFESRKKFFVQERRKAKVLRSISGHIVFDKGPVGGASGSCLLNERNEAIGVVIRSYPSVGVGVAIDITGDWNPTKE